MRRLMKGFGLALLITALAVLVMPEGRALAQNVACYFDQGGAGFHAGSGCTATVESGGILNVASGGAFKIAGTTLSATAAQFNAIAGVTAGTASASKAAVLGATKNLDTLVLADGGLYLGSGAGTAVTATAAELNYTDVTTVGVAQANKAAILGTNKELDQVHTAALYLGAAAGTLVTATAANLNAIPTATGTGTEIDEMTKNVMSSASTATLSASSAVQTCTITLKDADGNAIAAVQRVRVYLATTAGGVTLAAAANGTVAPTTGTVLTIHTAKLDWDLLTDVNGVIVLSIDNTGGADHYAVYVVVVLPNGKIKASLVTDVRSA